MRRAVKKTFVEILSRNTKPCYCAVTSRKNNYDERRLLENTTDARRVTIPLRKKEGERKTIAFPERAI